MARGEARRTPRGSAGSARRVKALSKLHNTGGRVARFAARSARHASPGARTKDTVAVWCRVGCAPGATFAPRAPKRVVRGVCTTPPHTAFECGRAPTARDPGALRALFRSKTHGTHPLRGFRARGVRLEDASGVWGGRPFRSRT